MAKRAEGKHDKVVIIPLSRKMLTILNAFLRVRVEYHRPNPSSTVDG